jgi:serine-type D-Ala-D-Ala endopeptidase (penicillin-binding protein 7)
VFCKSLILLYFFLLAILSVALIFLFIFCIGFAMATKLTFGFLLILRRCSAAMLLAVLALGLTALPVSQAEAATKRSAKAAKAKPVVTSKKQMAVSKTAAHSSKISARGSKVSASSSKSMAKAPAKMQRVVMIKNGKRVVVMRRAPVIVVAEPPRPSHGQLAGLHATQDPLDLKSSVAYVLDQDTNEILFQKNENAVLPIASLTKLMTAVIVSEAQLDPQEIITITEADVDTEKGSRSRLKVGTQLTRSELMLLALMSSENRAAHALGRSYPGGLPRFVQAMNAKAKLIGMQDTSYVEPTGLSSRNQSSAKDLATLTGYAYNDKSIRELSVSPDHQIVIDEKPLNYVNTNRLVRGSDWEIGLQKTGFISEAGHTLLMQAKIAGRRVIMVFLDSAGKLSRLGDAERVRRWVEGNPLPVQRVGAVR